MSGGDHVLTNTSGGVGTITLNRPEKLNAFVGSMREEFAGAVRALAADEEVRAIVITGAGRAFCAGADIAYMQDLLARRDTAGFAALVEAGRAAVTAIRQTPKPVIASVNGAAAGGGASLALACDLRIASENASLGQTFSRIGLHPDWGGSYFLPRLVGPSRALDLVFTGRMVEADEALRIGLFDRVVPHNELPAETEALAAALAAGPPKAIALAKRAIYGSMRKTLGEMLDVELEHQLTCFGSEDAAEGFRAFLEKRPPAFRGA